MKLIDNAAKAAQLLRPYFANEEVEHIYVLTLNNAGYMTSIRLVGLGSDTSIVFPVKQIAKAALLDNACNIIIAHNHPSSDVTPSVADVNQTEKLSKALQLLDMKLMDHIIVGQNQFFSFSDDTKHTF